MDTYYKMEGHLDELDKKWNGYRNILAEKCVLKKYKPAEGDLMDELFAKSLNVTKFCEIPIKRLTEDKYLFGEKEFRAKIVNNRFLIYVGGGYMSVDDFIY